jgi:hypothetical protein
MFDIVVPTTRFPVSRSSACSAVDGDAERRAALPRLPRHDLRVQRAALLVDVAAVRRGMRQVDTSAERGK